MVQRVTVSPSEVRGYGDIVSPKTTEDFTEYMCSVTESDGVYTLAYDDTATYLTLSASPTTITYGESTVLTATLTVEGEKASGEIVYFYEGETLLGSDETDSNGVATLTKSNFSIGSHSVKAVYDEIESSTVTVTVNKVTPTITFASDKSVLVSGESFTLSGVLSVGSGVTVKLYDNNVYVKDLTTGTGGAFSETVTNAETASHSYKLVYEGTSVYESVTSSTVSVNVLDSNYIELGVTGSSFSSYNNSPFTYTGDVFVDWDDGNIVEYTGGTLSHNYSSSGNYTVKVHGAITGLGDYCFRNCTGLTSISLPDSITSIGEWALRGCTGLTSFIIPDSIITLGKGCFYECEAITSITIPDTVTSVGMGVFGSCTSLTEIVLEWDSSSEIVSYDGTWLGNCPLFNYFLIPQGTKSLYTAKNYPSALLKEDGEPTPATITLTGTKSILSYADSESSVLTATVLDDNDDPVEGATVELYKNNVLWDTLTTGSAGTVSKTYTSAGIGDVGFTAECGSLVTEIFGVEDCIRYDSTDYVNVDAVKNWDLPSQFKLSFKILSDSWSGSSGSMNIALIRFNNSTGVWCGKGSSTSRTIYAPNGVTLNSIPANTDVEYTLTYDNGNCSFTDGTSTVTTTASLTKLYLIAAQESNHAHLKNIKIKPL